MTREDTLTGGCLCGSTRYDVSAPPNRVALCHCRMCQRWTGTGFAAGAEFRADSVSWNREPTLYQSSERGFRTFCADCGSSIGYQWLDSGTVWIQLGTLDEPDRVRPQFHIFTADQRSWAETEDSLPRHPGFAPD